MFRGVRSRDEPCGFQPTSAPRAVLARTLPWGEHCTGPLLLKEGYNSREPFFMRREVLFVLALVAMVGCNGAQGESQDTTKATFETGLKKTETKDVVVGKPIRFNPKQKAVEQGDLVWVRYKGKLSDGSVFDSNDPREKKDADPYTFLVGNGEVIKGWDIGLVGMQSGGIRKISVPWKEAYGEAGRGLIPPKADLFFDVQLLDVQKPSELGIYDFLDIKKGSGPEVKKGSVVTVHFVITQVGGRIAESTYDRKKTETFTIGKEEVLATFEDGITGMRQGGIRELRIPPEIGFSTNTGVASMMMTYAKIELIKVR